MKAGDLNALEELYAAIHDNGNGRGLQYVVKKFKEGNKDKQVDNVVGVLEEMERNSNKRYLWYSHRGKQPQPANGADFEYIFLCSASNVTAPRAERGLFTQVECLIQTLKGGRYHLVGLHIDDTHQKANGWLLLSCSSYDTDLAKQVDLAYMLARIHDGQRWCDKANKHMYKTFFDCLIQVVRDYLGIANFKVHFHHVVSDQAPEITEGQMMSWSAHDPNYYRLDDNGRLIGCVCAWQVHQIVALTCRVLAGATSMIHITSMRPKKT